MTQYLPNSPNPPTYQQAINSPSYYQKSTTTYSAPYTTTSYTAPPYTTSYTPSYRSAYTSVYTPTYAPMYTPVQTLIPIVNTDSGLNTSYIAQKEMTEYLYYRVLDKWLYDEELSRLLKYIKMDKGRPTIVANITEFKENKLKNNTRSDIESKADFIQQNIFSVRDMKHLLQRMVEELGYKWYDLPKRELLVVEVVEKHIKRKLKDMAKL